MFEVGVLRCVNQGYIETPTHICTYICMFFVSREYGEYVDQRVSEVHRVCELYGF